MGRSIFAKEKTFELTTGNIISIDGGFKVGTTVKIMHPTTKSFMPITAGTYILKDGGKIRTDAAGKLIDFDAPAKMSIHPARSFMSIDFPRAFMAFAKERYYLSSEEEITLSEGLTTGSLVHRINKAPENKTPTILESGRYTLTSGTVIWVNKDGAIYRIETGSKTKMKAAFIDNPGIKGPNDIEIQLKDGTKAVAVGGLRVKAVLMTQETNGTQVPLNPGIYELLDKRFILVEAGGAIVKISTDRPKPAANYAALKYEMSAKKLSARQKLINKFNAIRK